MQVRADQLAGHLQRGLKPLYVVHGDEPLLAQEAGDAVRAAARAAGHAERQVFTVSGAHFDWSGLLGAAQAMSLFAERRLIELRLPSGKPGKEGSEALQRYCERLPDDLVTLVMLPRLDRQQQGSAWFTALDAAGVSVRVDPIERRALPAWLAQRLAAQGQRVATGEEGERTLAFFADRVEGNLLAAHQELQKLALLFPAGTLTFEQVQSAVLNVARYSVAQFAEAVLAGQVGRALRMLDGLKAEGEAPVLVHWTLAEDIRALRRVQDAMAQGRPLPMALREQRVWGVKEKLFERLLPGMSDHAGAHLVAAAQVCDGLVKGLKHPDWPADPWDGLRRLALMVLEHSAAAGARQGTTGLRLALPA
ncbi:DNA polymerase III subunit delta [Aquabacterium sp. J223]|uniref:DNA polymerase III subunit delta n=1 Tax=Aquabacterium sp. J223 TaxID=2898431 RepID=UPI0021ADD610|nr:DNA polymerase III subunit delta [Aquabacterium sp. J223]UUX95890.1 DNA polymerase III subunit delta [Aquabacterium sp. J223]